jgi:hypothetical protein
MTDAIKPIRRVVTGNDAQGRSCVQFDSAAPNVKTSPFQKGTNMTDLWVFHSCPAVITGERDDGNLPFHFEPPRAGGHLRVVQSAAKPKDYDPAKAPSSSPRIPRSGPKAAPGSAAGRTSSRRARTSPRPSTTASCFPASACWSPTTGSARSSPATWSCRSEAGTPGATPMTAARWPSS